MTKTETSKTLKLPVAIRPLSRDSLDPDILSDVRSGNSGGCLGKLSYDSNSAYQSCRKVTNFGSSCDQVTEEIVVRSQAWKYGRAMSRASRRLPKTGPESYRFDKSPSSVTHRPRLKCVCDLAPISLGAALSTALLS